MSIAPEELEGNQNAVIPDELMQAFPILGALMGGGAGGGDALGGYTGALSGPTVQVERPEGGRRFDRPTSRPAYTDEDARAPRNWAPEDIEELQLELVESGFITEDQAKRMIPGQFDPLTHAGFTNLLTHANAIGKTWEIVVDEFTAAGGVAAGQSDQKDPIVVGGNVGGGNVYKIQLSDPASIRSLADRIARSVLGRKPKKGEMDKILSEIHGAELNVQQTVHNAQEGADQAKFNAATNSEVQTAHARTGAANGMQTIISPVPGVEAPADTMGADRDGGARKHKGTDIFGPKGSPAVAPIGGTILEAGDGGGKSGKRVWIKGDDGRFHFLAHLDSVAVKDGQRIEQGAPIGTVGNSGNAKNTPAHVHYSINSQMGSEDAIGNPAVELRGGGHAGHAAGGFGVDQFMAAIAATESGGDNTPYDAQNPSGAHGKFQIMPANWKSWAKEAGLPSNAAKTPENQDKVARFKMEQYHQQFGSWEAVAVAWFAGPDDAALYAKGDRSMLGKSDGNMTVGEYVERAKSGMSMPSGNNPDVIQTPNTYLPASSVTVTDVDPAARTEELLREGAPIEAAAHTIASDTYGAFLKIIGAQ